MHINLKQLFLYIIHKEEHHTHRFNRVFGVVLFQRAGGTFLLLVFLSVFFFYARKVCVAKRERALCVEELLGEVLCEFGEKKKNHINCNQFSRSDSREKTLQKRDETHSREAYYTTQQ